MSISRRKFIELAASFGASLAFRSVHAHASSTDWTDRIERTKVEGTLPLVV